MVNQNVVIGFAILCVLCYGVTHYHVMDYVPHGARSHETRGQHHPLHGKRFDPEHVGRNTVPVERPVSIQKQQQVASSASSILAILKAAEAREAASKQAAVAPRSAAGGRTPRRSLSPVVSAMGGEGDDQDEHDEEFVHAGAGGGGPAEAEEAQEEHEQEREEEHEQEREEEHVEEPAPAPTPSPTMAPKRPRLAEAPRAETLLEKRL
eukprot:CAMPEP_0182900358 /NCGR_PEP_ID=MMETSP0034_2-20130328/28789_1 /TAXON_ID=156128 /ORGANISM="Nephroselmis pyriformis, Strain CCMP717" /LENGTH=207 /DNA_ID=CAMNT_0025034561 /DNA_START=29 /DNA_END=648 /DNA_ORIENTATION=+